MTHTFTKLSILGLGCSRIGSFNNAQSMRESRALIEAALDMGVTTIDTSNIYGQGDSEIQIGRVLKGKREKAFVITKTGRGFSSKMRMLRPLKPIIRPLAMLRKSSHAGGGAAVTARRESEMRQDWRPSSLGPSLEMSLRRLQTDYVDGLLLHSPDASIAGDPRIGRALCDLKAQGKLRQFGVSCDDYASFAAALTMPGLSLLQLPWDVIASLDDTDMQRLRDSDITVLAREVVRFQPGLTPAQAVAKAARNAVIDCVLVGTTKQAHLRQLATALREHVLEPAR